MLGYDYPDGEEQLTVLKRNLCISEAADSGEERFEIFLKFINNLALSMSSLYVSINM